MLAPGPLAPSGRRGLLTATASSPEGFSWPWKHSGRQLSASRKYWSVNVPGSRPLPLTKRKLVDK